MPVRLEYILQLAASKPRAGEPAPAGAVVRGVSPGDLRNLAELMLDAYRNTIDYDGEGIAEAITEVENYFARAAKRFEFHRHQRRTRTQARPRFFRTRTVEWALFSA